MSATPVTYTVDHSRQDARIEAWLDAHHVDWTFNPELPLDQIDIRRSLANQARPGEALLPDTVELYTAGYRKGDLFPPIVARRTSRQAKKLVVIDGNHRTNSAVDAGVTTHPAYVITCEDETAMVLMYDANLKNGAQLPKAQRIALAVHLVETGMEGKVAARQMAVAESEISNARTLNRAALRARDNGVAGWDQIPQGHRLDLARIGSDPVFAATAQLVQKAGLQGGDVKDLVRRVKAARSDDAALVLIGGEIEARQADIQKRHGGVSKSNRRRRVTEWDRFTDALTVLENVNAVDVDESAPTAEARRDGVKRIERLVKNGNLTAVHKALKS